MESYWSPKGRVQASNRAHHSAIQSDRNREDATKRVANVSLRLADLEATGGRLRAAPAPISRAALGAKPGRYRLLLNDNAIADRPGRPNSLRSPGSNTPQRTERTQGDD
jgi:hypothetical protein